MSNVTKIIMFLIIGAIILDLVTHPAGAAGGMVAGGSVLNKSLAIESGQGITSGTTGSVNTSTGAMTFG